MDLEAMLRCVFEDRWPADLNAYELNTELKLPPWSNPAPAIWRAHVKGEPLHDGAPGDQAVLDMLLRLYDDYLESGVKPE